MDGRTDGKDNYFVVRPEFGLAGRVKDTFGAPLPDVRVELVDSDGNVVKTSVTDRFGLYRMDGLPIGRYTLRPAPESRPAASIALASREIEIRDDFLFDQDLIVHR